MSSFHTDNYGLPGVPVERRLGPAAKRRRRSPIGNITWGGAETDRIGSLVDGRHLFMSRECLAHFGAAAQLIVMFTRVEASSGDVQPAAWKK